MTDRNHQIPPALLGSAGLSRRRVLRGAGMAGAAAFLAACGVKGTKDGATPAASAPPAAPSSGGSSAPSSSQAPVASNDKTLTWSNWPEYLDVNEDNPDIHPSLDEFEKQTGIKVKYTEDVNDNDQYFAKIQPQLAGGQVIGADVFVVTDWMAAKLIQLGYAEELDHANMPNLKNMQPGLMNVSFDPGRKKSVTWQSGLAGIAYNPAATGGKSVDTIDQLLTDPALKGKVALLTEMRDTVGLAMLDLGYDCSDFTEDEFNKTIAKLQAAVDSKQIRQFTGNDYAAGLISGDIAACVAWTGDVAQLLLDNPDLKYVLPEPGCTLWSDNFVVPVGTPRKANAEALINYYYDPAVAAPVAEYINYISPVVGAKELLLKADPEIANNQLIFPSDETLKRAHVFMGLDAEQEKKYSAAFAKLTGS